MSLIRDLGDNVGRGGKAVVWLQDHPGLCEEDRGSDEEILHQREEDAEGAAGV